MLIRIELPYATFGLISENGIIKDAPPISKSSIGRKTNDVIKYYENVKKARVLIIRG